MSAVAACLPDGRLHLQHGPIDLIIGVDGKERRQALEAARDRFGPLLSELVAKLPLLRRPVGGTQPTSPCARRMYAATLPHARQTFVTPMAAVAGAVADEVLAAMASAADMDRAYVNNGGDIALHLSGGGTYRLGIAGLDGIPLGTIAIDARDEVRGIATSGRGGRSFSLGIADSVTVLARSAAEADAAATLIANEVDLPGHPAIDRCPARDMDPDSDLGNRLVVTGCGALSADEIDIAIARGRVVADRMRCSGHLISATLLLRGHAETVGQMNLERIAVTCNRDNSSGN